MKPKKVKPVVAVPVAWDDTPDLFKKWWVETWWTGNGRKPLNTKENYDETDDATKSLTMRWFEFDFKERATYTALFVDGTPDSLVSQFDCSGLKKIALDTNSNGRKTYSLVERDDYSALRAFRKFEDGTIESISALHMDGTTRDVPLDYEEPATSAEQGAE